jgi:PleD family two-component response regulator
VKQWIYHRRLPAVKLSNGYWKVKVHDFECFLKARNEVGRRRILLTDVKESDLKEMVSLIEKLGHSALVARNYPDAMLKAADHHPALFVINISFKDSDPWKLTEKLRGVKALRNVPILLLSSTEFTDTQTEKALELGAHGLLTHPLNFETVSIEIKRILDRNL